VKTILCPTCGEERQVTQTTSNHCGSCSALRRGAEQRAAALMPLLVRMQELLARMTHMMLPSKQERQWGVQVDNPFAPVRSMIDQLELTIAALIDDWMVEHLAMRARAAAKLLPVEVKSRRLGAVPVSTSVGGQRVRAVLASHGR